MVGTAAVGTAEVGTAEVGTAEVGTAEVGMAAVGMAAVGMAAVGMAVGLSSSIPRQFLNTTPTPIRITAVTTRIPTITGATS